MADTIQDLANLASALKKATEYFPGMPDKFKAVFNDADSTIVVMKHMYESIDKYLANNMGHAEHKTGRRTERKADVDALDLLYNKPESLPPTTPTVSTSTIPTISAGSSVSAISTSDSHVSKQESKFTMCDKIESRVFMGSMGIKQSSIGTFWERKYHQLMGITKMLETFGDVDDGPSYYLSDMDIHMFYQRFRMYWLINGCSIPDHFVLRASKNCSLIDTLQTDKYRNDYDTATHRSIIMEYLDNNEDWDVLTGACENNIVVEDDEDGAVRNRMRDTIVKFYYAKTKSQTSASVIADLDAFKQWVLHGGFSCVDEPLLENVRDYEVWTTLESPGALIRAGLLFARKIIVEQFHYAYQQVGGVFVDDNSYETWIKKIKEGGTPVSVKQILASIQ